ncbi:16S rRNA (uracil(1498)-N(3))-methyltransferase [Ketobacter sp.]|uniref:16S rRNA (uracil(1498)-N(3))-methyltransferase n=1 Tax=Ketobacter sp. TaxID=2083498 RepID=UPI000F2DCEAB|nr:16S rRNA (uracil(1498)-N(3))-methyltransferase [Ketobacter sp.]MEE2733403.1 16S rRNA (uracil(1498)-N(3))-methyltransferase [Pseudomonadota bacterium]RLT93091.1 MAG: 16S rRNA (uracil(1498)-N(3))-methyltransferase [Ketobacter sp.]
MNVILIHPREWGQNTASGRLVIADRRHHHLVSVIKPKPGEWLRVGLLGGPLGMARVVTLDTNSVTLDITLDTPPPPPLPVTLLLALPRPKVLRRTLQACTTLGVKEIFLINSFRVEKSYWQTPFLQQQALQETLLLGLEQARDSVLPQVHLRQRFKPFVEDELPALVTGKPAWLAHPTADAGPCPSGVTAPCLLAVGPEGGFIPYEVEQLQRAGFACISLGPRILKVETAVPALLGKLFL